MSKIFNDYVLEGHGIIEDEVLNNIKPIEFISITDTGDEDGNPIDDFVYVHTGIGNYSYFSQIPFLGLLQLRFPKFYEYIKIGIVYSWNIAELKPISRNELYKNVIDIEYIKYHNLINSSINIQNISELYVLLLLNHEYFAIDSSLYPRIFSDIYSLWTKKLNPGKWIGTKGSQKYFSDIYKGNTTESIKFQYFASINYIVTSCKNISIFEKKIMNIKQGQSIDLYDIEGSNISFLSNTIINLMKLMDVNNIDDINLYDEEGPLYFIKSWKCQMALLCIMNVSLSQNLYSQIPMSKSDIQYYSTKIPNLNLQFIIPSNILRKQITSYWEGRGEGEGDDEEDDSERLDHEENDIYVTSIETSGIFKMEELGKKDLILKKTVVIENLDVRDLIDNIDDTFVETDEILLQSNDVLNISKNKNLRSYLINIIRMHFIKSSSDVINRYNTLLYYMLVSKVDDILSKTSVFLVNNIKITLKEFYINILIKMHMTLKSLDKTKNSISTFFGFFCRSYASINTNKELLKYSTIDEKTKNKIITFDNVSKLKNIISQRENNLKSQLFRQFAQEYQKYIDISYNSMKKSIPYDEIYIIPFKSEYFTQDTLKLIIKSVIEYYGYIIEKYDYDDISIPIINSLTSENSFVLIDKTDSQQVLGIIGLRWNPISIPEIYYPDSKKICNIDDDFVEMYDSFTSMKSDVIDENTIDLDKTLEKAYSLWSICVTDIGKKYSNTVTIILSKFFNEKLFEKSDLVINDIENPIEIIIDCNDIEYMASLQNIGFKLVTQDGIPIMYKNRSLIDKDYYRMIKFVKTSKSKLFLYDKQLVIHSKEYVNFLKENKLYLELFNNFYSTPDINYEI